MIMIIWFSQMKYTSSSVCRSWRWRCVSPALLFKPSNLTTCHLQQQRGYISPSVSDDHGLGWLDSHFPGVNLIFLTCKNKTTIETPRFPMTEHDLTHGRRTLISAPFIYPNWIHVMSSSWSSSSSSSSSWTVKPYNGCLYCLWRHEKKNRILLSQRIKTLDSAADGNNLM